jgi:rRNA maturation endonuclease Nob1
MNTWICLGCYEETTGPQPEVCTSCGGHAFEEREEREREIATIRARVLLPWGGSDGA